MSTQHGTDQPVDHADGTVVDPTDAATSATEQSQTPPAGAGRSRSGLLAPLVVLLVVGALAIAAMSGGSDDAAEEEVAAPSQEQPVDALPEELVTDDGAALEDQVADQQLADEDARQALDAMATREPDDPRALGDPDAPVAMVQWADFLCPFCGVFARDTEPELIARYVDTGLMRIEWRDLPFQGDQALLAAVGGHAAAAQDAFWEFHEALFAEDLRTADNRVNREFLLDIAAQLDLDLDAFAADLEDPELAERVEGEAILGQSLGISGTPAFIIGGYPLVGAQPIESFVQVIEAAAQDAGAELP